MEKNGENLSCHVCAFGVENLNALASTDIHSLIAYWRATGSAAALNHGSSHFNLGVLNGVVNGLVAIYRPSGHCMALQTAVIPPQLQQIAAAVPLRYAIDINTCDR